jgi:hypothetical protein
MLLAERLRIAQTAVLQIRASAAHFETVLGKAVALLNRLTRS